MSPLRSIARWSAGPAIGITLGLILGTLADGPAAPPARVAVLTQPAAPLPATGSLPGGPRHGRAWGLPPPGWARLAAGD